MQVHSLSVASSLFVARQRGFWYIFLPMKPADTATIAAIATPPGEGAISVVRLSGERALEIADRLFRGRTRLKDANGYTVHHGLVEDSRGSPIDEVLATIFRSPHSYTGEDVVEFSCHGGLLVTQSLLGEIVRAGARYAEPGEFSKRAFLNGKMDLSQAEAVADVIAARSDRARAISVQQLAGKLGARVRELRTALTNLCALLELDLDFNEEGLELIGPEEIRRKIFEVRGIISRMLETYDSGRISREGATVVIAGKPNAGKSSLFNALLKERRAIVTPHPGTTRDTIEESVLLEGILFNLVDTAGLRDATDLAEREGVNRALEYVQAADIILLVEDTTVQVEEREIESMLGSLVSSQHLVVALNKTDLPGVGMDPSERHRLTARGARVVPTSARTGIGLQELRRALVESVIGPVAEPSAGVELTNNRHREAFARSHESLDNAIETLDSGRTNEFVALDVREAALALGEVTGEVSSEEILNSIFARFCIGK
jgi:tRNA modification GTPase